MLTWYTIQPGDNIFRLAKRFNTTVDAILYFNPRIRSYHPPLGQRIRIPILQYCDREFSDTANSVYPDEINNYSLEEKVSINQLVRDVRPLKYTSYGAWDITADVETTISPSGLVRANVTNIKKRYDEAWVSMNFKASIVSVERENNKIKVVVQVNFEGLSNKFRWPYGGDLKWGPALDHTSTFEEKYIVYFDDIENIENIETEDSEINIYGPEFSEPSQVTDYYSIEIVALTPTTLGTSLNSPCKLQITVIKTNKETRITENASGVKVIISKPTIGAISTTELITDINGQGIIYYTSPSEEELGNKEAEVYIEVRETASGSTDGITLIIRSEYSELTVIAEHDIIPSNKEYSNQIWIRFTGASKPDNTSYKATISTSLGYGLLKKSISDETPQTKLTVELWPNEDEYCYYQWYGEAKLEQALDDIISVIIPELKLEAQVKISVGIDLMLTGVRLKSGDFYSGRDNPFLVYVIDNFHAEVDLSQLFDAYQIRPKLTIEQIEYISPGINAFNSNQQDIFSFIIAKIAGLAAPEESSFYGLLQSTAKKEPDGSYTLVDDFWGTAEKFRPAVTPSDIGDYRYKFTLVWEEDSNDKNNSINTDLLTVADFSPEQESFYTIYVPIMRTLLAAFTPYGVIDTLMQASIKLYEAKYKEAMIELGTGFLSLLVGKVVNQLQWKILLEESRLRIMDAVKTQVLSNDQVVEYMGKAYKNFFPTITAASFDTLFSAVKEELLLNSNTEQQIRDYAKQSTSTYFHSNVLWKNYRDFVKGYGSYGIVILSTTTLKSYQAFGMDQTPLTEIPDQIFGGGEESEIICSTEDIICIPFELSKLIEVHLSGTGQQRMEATMYATLARLFIITPLNVKSYSYPKNDWKSMIKVGGDGIVSFEGEILVISQDVSVGPAIFISFSSAIRGQEVEVNFTAEDTYSKDAWIGIIPADIPHGPQDINDKSDIAYRYLNGLSEGTLKFNIPQTANSGSYEFRMFPDDREGSEVAHSAVIQIK